MVDGKKTLVLYPRTEKALGLVFKLARKEIEDATILSRVLDKLLVAQETLNGRESSNRKSKV